MTLINSQRLPVTSVVKHSFQRHFLHDHFLEEGGGAGGAQSSIYSIFIQVTESNQVNLSLSHTHKKNTTSLLTHTCIIHFFTQDPNTDTHI